MSTYGIRDRRHSRLTDIGLRVAGLLALTISWVSIHALVRIHAAQPHGEVGAGGYLLAALGFVCGSIGSALLALGHHIFDEVKISARWDPRIPSRAADLDAQVVIGWPPRSAVSSHQEHESEVLFSRGA